MFSGVAGMDAIPAPLLANSVKAKPLRAYQEKKDYER
jgi:hypothetical protein